MRRAVARGFGPASAEAHHRGGGSRVGGTLSGRVAYLSASTACINARMYPSANAKPTLPPV